MRKIALNFFILFLVTNAALAQRFKVSYADSAFNKPFTGHVLLYLSKVSKEPKDGTAGLDIFPCFDLVVKGVMPGTAVTFDDSAVSFRCHCLKLNGVNIMCRRFGIATLGAFYSGKPW